MKKYPPSPEEIDAAVLAFCDLAAADRKLFRGYRRVLPKLRAGGKEVQPARRRLGRLLIRRYRRDTGDLEAIVVGGPRWEAFRAWLKEHMAEINFAKLIVAVLTLMLMFI